MHKTIIAGVAALFMTTTAPLYAQGGPSPLPSAADLKALTDVRVGLVKGALQLNPEQTKLWPAVEEAIRARATMRQDRLAKLAEIRTQPKEPGPIEIMRFRAEGLALRSAALKKLADAWQPLYDSLDADQRFRLGVVVETGFHVLMTAIDQRDGEEEEE